MVGLSEHVGAEGFFCIVCNSTDFHMKPKWYFTSKELMRIAVGRKTWNTEAVGSKIEVFAIAGCDIMGLLHTGKQKSSYLKREISQAIHEGLHTVTGRADITMQYVNYEGWTPAKFVNPSELSDAIGPLQELFTAIKNGTCKFVKLTPQERIDWKQKYDADVAAGRHVAKHCQPCNDIGRKRKAAEGSRREMLDEDEDEDNDPPCDESGDTESIAAPPAKCCRVTKTAAVPAGDEHDNEQEEREVQPPPHKAKTTCTKPTKPSKKTPAKKASTTRMVIENLRARAKKSRAIISDDKDDDPTSVPINAAATGDASTLL
ncbi:hypothetical protein B0H14DRAFT_3863116 [Mycena olivaceomarginata]|nr:hypothetical protein B0H14DRAFT_3863116 [Mycena olivaceomarginata]